MDSPLTNVANAFHSIMILYTNLMTLFPYTEPNKRNDHNKTISLNFIQYQHKIALYTDLLPIPLSLDVYERSILNLIATGKLLLHDNSGVKSMLHSIKQIERILLDMIPPESEEYQKLLVDIPDLKKFTPQI